MVTDDSYTSGEHSIMHKEFETLHCIAEISLTCVNYTKNLLKKYVYNKIEKI